MPAEFGPDDLRRCLIAALGAARAHQAAIDEANVYPVPDGDTGTNLVLTLSAAAEALGAGDPFRTAPQASLVGARGNSGVVLSQWLRGLCADGPIQGAAQLRAALRRASDRAWEAILEPVEGTILSVARAAAEDAHGTTVPEVLEAAAAAARTATDRTPEQLPLLAEAGVVDAGAMGLWVVIDAFAAQMTGRAPAPAPEQPTTPRLIPREAGSSAYAYEVQYLLEAPDAALEPLKSALGTIGDSVVVSGGGGLWNIHVHTNQVDAAVAIGTGAGAVRGTAVTAFADVAVGRAAAGRAVPIARAVRPVTVVAVVAGGGFARLYGELGAGVLVDGGSTMNPSVGEIVAAIERAPAGDVIVLPNSANAIPAAMQACEFVEKRRTVVIETRDLAHGVTTMLAYGDARDLDTNAAQMRQAASVAATARVAIAVRDATTPAGPVRAGQAMAFTGDAVTAVGDDPVEVTVRAVAAMDAEEPVEVATVFAADDVPAGERAALEKALRQSLPGVDVDVRDGGQPVERYLIAVE